MKKAAKIIIPILLALAILLGTAWYLFVYDREFTRDMFLHTARFFHERGNYEIAQWCYECAYNQSSDNDAVAIELSRQHASDGNYVQAEKALTKAIADSASAELYIALSNLYLEQNKVIAAIDLMDDICAEDSSVDAAIRENLAKRRPAAPKATPIVNSEDPELYSSVEFTATGGTLYINKEGTYPSYTDKSHRFTSGTKKIILDEGANDIYAITISDEGLVSALTNYQYELNSNHRRVAEVTFADPAMEIQLRNALNVDATKVVMTSDLWTITSFTVPEEAKNLDDLYHLIGLEQLTIQSGPSDALKHLQDMEKLEELSVIGTVLSQEDLAMLSSLPRLEKLTLNKCGLTVLTGLENATNLTYLDLSSNSIVDITPITGLTKLTELNLNGNSLSSLEGISGLTSLTVLNASNNVLTSLEDITGCISLTKLNVSNNKLTSIDSVTQIQGLANLNFANNDVTTLPQWDKSCKLVTIDGSYNDITSVEPLSGLENLNNVYMDYNENLESIACLKDCYMLIQVNVYGTKIKSTKDFKDLLDMSVIVKYDPT